ncbi:MAG TPA: Ig-like domain-containing protein, partial [Candidatus Binatia bacterium]|nr:Ig-like domain-containing protein [Candidatus Binatia bacterium]
DGGTVSFSYNGTDLGCGPVAVAGGQAQCSTSSLPVGSDDVTATYSGDTDYGGSSGSDTVTVSAKTATVTSLTSSENPSTVGDQVTFTATVSPRPDGGTVDFSDPSGSLCAGVTVSTSDGEATCQHAFTAAGSYGVTATYGGDANFMASPASNTVTQVVDAPQGGGGGGGGATTYTPLQPFRICDTRAGAGFPCSGDAADNRLGAGESLVIQVTGVEGPQYQAVPAGASAVVVNVTAVQPSAPTYLTVYPSGHSVPTASNLNLIPGAIQANLVVGTLNSTGQISIYNSNGSVDLVVDVEGYFSPGTGGSGLYHALSPIRLCDTRAGTGTPCSGHPILAGMWAKVDLAGAGSVPSNGTAEAVVMNVTGTGGTAGTFLSVAPPNSSDQCPSAPPEFSNLNMGAGSTLPNRVIVPVGPDQDVCVYNSQGTENAVLDVDGWFGNGQEEATGFHYYAISPTRLCDTRGAAGVGYTTECTGDPLTTGATMNVPVAGMSQITGTGAPVAVIANVTGVSGTAGTFLTLYPAGEPLPLASDLNPGPGQVVPNMAVISLATSGGQAGSFDLYNDQGRIDAIVDIEGWFA